jgi:putative endonuclease
VPAPEPRPGSGRRVDPRRALGAAGEAQAAAWYGRRGYRILDRNWRCREGELDLVVAKGRAVVFVEVKARRTVRYGTPAEAVTPAKQRRLRVLALRWIEATGARPASMRFDVVAILGDRLEVIEAAFLPAPGAAAAPVRPAGVVPVPA